MKNDKGVLIISAIDPTRAYSCIKYLFMALRQNEVEVECWSRVPSNNMESYKKWGNGTKSFCTCFLSKIPKISTIYMLAKGFVECYKYRNKTIICNDLFHYKVCVLIKKMFPETKIIEYFTEIYNEQHSSFLYKLQKYFEQHPNVMDLMIECDFKREQYRINCNGVYKPSDTILNTIPLSEIEEIRKLNINKEEIPVVVYSGGIHAKGEFSIIIDALKKIDLPYRIDFYCFGPKEAIADLVEECQEKLANKYNIITNKGREEVLRSIANADIGIVYYDPEFSINTRYAAPTKFFEYISLGIPVVTSGNESLVRLISEYKLGAYMKTNDINGMREALFELLSDTELRKDVRNSEINAFDNVLCYECQSKSAIKKILDLVNR